MFEVESSRENNSAVESVGLATALSTQACRQSGLSTLTHTPNPMKFLNEILERPQHEQLSCALGGWVPVIRCTDAACGNSEEAFM